MKRQKPVHVRLLVTHTKDSFTAFSYHWFMTRFHSISLNIIDGFRRILPSSFDTYITQEWSKGPGQLDKLKNGQARSEGWVHWVFVVFTEREWLES